MIRLYRLGAGVVIALLAMQPLLHAAENDWTLAAELPVTYGNYSGSLNRESIVSSGVLLHADYLEKSGFSLGGNYTLLKAKVGNSINQQQIYGSLYYNTYLDALPGALTWRLDGYAINNNDITGNTDRVKVIAPQLSFLNYGKTIYLDMGYAYSTYSNNLKVHQFTPTLGFALNDAADWIQLRGYLIKPSNALRAQNKNSTAALGAMWMHWFAPGAVMVPEKMIVGGLIGDRIYAVDNDAATVYNLTDVQRGSVSLGMQWKTGEHSSLLLMLGNEFYLNNLTGNRYNNRFAHLNISTRW